jgi:hypothetical protein
MIVTNFVGTTFYEGTVELKVVESKDNGATCRSCWYNEWHGKKRNYPSGCYIHGHACTSGNRTDKKQVIFKEVKE